MKNSIERYGRQGDKEACLIEMPILGQRQISQSVNSFFVQHMSDQIQVTYVSEGNIDFTLDGCVYHVKSGDIIINKPGQVFGAVNETFPKSKSAFFKINLTKELTGWDTAELALVKGAINNIIFPHLSVNKEFFQLFTKIINEHRNPSEFSPTKCRALYQQLLIFILEAHQDFLSEVNYKAPENGDLLTLVSK
ncbi:MAG: AraC family ligand binding domain-containing protein, partial [Lentisphaeraceae bacterium]|nr:AraC family ligand binding domain-containing protein [Lentisphaeraceae bacterium]